MFDRLVTPIIAIGLGFLVWVYIRSRDEAYDEREIPLTVMVAESQREQFKLARGETFMVPVVFSGPPSRIRETQNLFRQGLLRFQQTVTVPDDVVKNSNDANVTVTLRLDAATLSVPKGVNADIPELRKALTVNLKRIVEVRLPVRLNHQGSNNVERVVIAPSTVLVRGPKDLLERETSIPTELYVAPQLDPEKAELQLPPVDLRLAGSINDTAISTTPSVVQATITLKGPQRIHELADVPIHFLTPVQFPYRPKFTTDRAATITLRVRGPNTDLKPSIVAYLDLSNHKFGPGLHADEPVKVLLPPGYTLLTEPLPRVSIQLDPLDVPAPRNGLPNLPDG